MTLTRRTYLKTTSIAALGTIGVAGCTTARATTGTLTTQVTDRPGDISDFESCVVSVQGIWVKPGDEDGDEGPDATDSETNETDDGESEAGDLDTQEEGTDAQNESLEQDEEIEQQDEDDVDRSDSREYHAFDELQEADLVELQDGNTQLIDERELETGVYEFLQLDVTAVEGTLVDGSDVEVDTPGNAPLQFEERFEIREETATTFVADFTPVRRGQTERYLIQPVANGVRVEYESSS